MDKFFLNAKLFSGLLFLLVFVNSSFVFSQNDCDNMGFENGDLSEWVAGRGCNENGVNRLGRGDCHDQNSNWFRNCCPFPAVLSTDGSLWDWEARHTMISKGTDPYGGFPLVAPQLKGYPKSNYSLRLGNARRLGQADMVERSFVVDESNAIFAYQFAFVLNDPGRNHGDDQLPFFESGIYDEDGNKVPCSYLKVLANDSKFDSVVVDSVQDNQGNDMVVRYKNWNPIFINLTDRIGEELTIRFKDVDCAFGGHWGYSYITAYCGKYVPMRDTAICANEPVTLTSPFPIEGFHLKWSTGDTTEQITVNPAVTTTITLTVKNRTTFEGIDEDCEEVYSVAITVGGGDPPILKDTVVCLNETATLVAMPSGGTYEWYTDPSGGTPFHTGEKYTTPPLTDKVTYYVMATGKCASKERSPVTVEVIVVEAVAGPESVICNGGEQELNVEGGIDGSVYSWTPINSLDNPKSKNPIASPGVTTTYTVVVTDSEGRCPATDTVTIRVEEIVADLDGEDVCIGLETHFKNLTVPGNVGGDWLWEFGDGKKSDQMQPVHIYDAPGKYIVKLKVVSGTCESEDTVEVEVFPNPIAAFTPTPRKTTADDPIITFLDECELAVRGEWDFGDKQIEPYVPGENPVHLYYATNEDEGPFKYTIRLSVVSENGCPAEVVEEIEIENIWTIYVPNSFTPNGDGVNDYFKAYGIGILDFRMTVFNRWGEVVYRSDDISDGWDGTPISGSSMKQDVYVWKVKARNNRGKAIRLIGHVSLLPTGEE